MEDLYALHFVFSPIIQHHLNTFKSGWAHHKMRTENNKTPTQLWNRGFSNIDEDDPALTGLEVRGSIGV